MPLVHDEVDVVVVEARGRAQVDVLLDVVLQLVALEVDVLLDVVLLDALVDVVLFADELVEAALLVVELVEELVVLEVDVLEGGLESEVTLVVPGGGAASGLAPRNRCRLGPGPLHCRVDVDDAARDCGFRSCETASRDGARRRVGRDTAAELAAMVLTEHDTPGA